MTFFDLAPYLALMPFAIGVALCVMFGVALALDYRREPGEADVRHHLYPHGDRVSDVQLAPVIQLHTRRNHAGGPFDHAA